MTNTQLKEKYNFNQNQNVVIYELNPKKNLIFKDEDESFAFSIFMASTGTTSKDWELQIIQEEDGLHHARAVAIFPDETEEGKEGWSLKTFSIVADIWQEKKARNTIIRKMRKLVEQAKVA